LMDDYLNNWLVKAEHDLKAAEHELNRVESDVITDIVCFHCQQAVEKYLKAYLITHKVEFGKTHNLEYILELCAKIDKAFSDLELGKLSFYAVEIRYPDEFYLPTLEETRKSFELAGKIKDFVLPRIKRGNFL
jgi:HEPN domain-containing protein